MRLRLSARRSLGGVPWGYPRGQTKSSVLNKNVPGRVIEEEEELSQTPQVTATPLLSQEVGEPERDQPVISESQKE